MDTYAAVFQIKPERFAGQVREVTQGAIATCKHSHKSRSVALECAEKMLKSS